MGMFAALLSGLLLLSTAHAASVPIEAGAGFEERLQEALARAVPGTTFELPEGRFELQDELTLDRPGLTLRGRGPSRTVLSFRRQLTGAQGILASAHGVTLEDLAVEDTPG